MSRYLGKKASDHGDFSTSFADLVFGLLFVFFLLAIAMVFNKPEVDSFQKKIDELQKKLNEQSEMISKTQKELAERRTEIERLKAKKAEKTKTEEIRVASDRSESLKVEIDLLRKERHRIRKALDELQQENKRLRDEIKLLKEQKGTDISKISRELEQVRIRSGKQKNELEKLRKQNEIVKRHSRELQAIINKTKQILKKKGIVDILAEINKMEKNLKESERKDRYLGADELFNDFKLWVSYEPQSELLYAELWEGEEILDRSPSILAEEVVEVAKELAENYKVISKNYTELEKAEHKPRILLKIHPDSVYGDVQELLKSLKKGGIPVSIIPWDK
jgi:chromosome segregation ATPase